MRMIRIIVLSTLIAFLATTVVPPKRAEALSSGEIAAIVVGSIVGWFTLVFVGAALAYRKGSPKKEHVDELVADGRSIDGAAPRRRLRFGPECPAQGGPVPGIRPTACW
jgi:Na+/H+ antiporter NhaC